MADPYRWLEELDSEETKAWVEAENKLTFAYLAAIPARNALQDRITKLWNYEKYGVPFKEGNALLFPQQRSPEPVGALHRHRSRSPPKLILDPNTLSADGTVAVSGLQVSPDGNHLVQYFGVRLRLAGVEGSRRRNQAGIFPII